ncbi:hypothetical protein [Legionella geestiana]|nr:hypothetical protein [Legionella geestiana]
MIKRLALFAQYLLELGVIFAGYALLYLFMMQNTTESHFIYYNF